MSCDRPPPRLIGDQFAGCRPVVVLSSGRALELPPPGDPAATLQRPIWVAVEAVEAAQRGDCKAGLLALDQDRLRRPEREDDAASGARFSRHPDARGITSVEEISQTSGLSFSDELFAVEPVGGHNPWRRARIDERLEQFGAPSSSGRPHCCSFSSGTDHDHRGRRNKSTSLPSKYWRTRPWRALEAVGRSDFKGRCRARDDGRAAAALSNRRRRPPSCRHALFVFRI